MLRARPQSRQRGQPFEPAYAPPLDDQSSERPDRRGRRYHFQGSRLHQLPEIRFCKARRKGVSRKKKEKRRSRERRFVFSQKIILMKYA